MKSLKQIILMFAVVISLGLSVSAEKDDQKRPPKEKPPVIDPKEKPPRENPPKDQDKPKKPGARFYLVSVNRGGKIG